ncbi:MAG: ABC transporter ATP-binding protein [Clostridiales bacterium]|nr:ABC transporter ATP-binding protein [Clostridiales bacterium]
MIELKHLTKRYGTNLAVDDLNLTLEPGHVYGFLGPNGAGKSTTLNMITGYIGATGGEVIIEGHDINKEPEAAKKCMGYLPELPPVYGDMRVGEYLNFAADLKGLKRATRVADIRQVMDLTRLYDMENRLIKNLSKGYRQRVGLAQALMGMPPVIILDEPTVGLDPKQIIEIRELIASLKEDHTVILSSHILQEISAVCDYVFIISHGKLVADDTMENLENQMSGGQQLELELKATARQARGLKGVEGVKICEVEDTSAASEPAPELPGDKEESGGDIPAAEDKPVMPKPHTDTAKVILTAKPDADIREAVFNYCAANGIVILEMRTVTKSLEDVFLALTEDKEVA